MLQPWYAKRFDEKEYGRLQLSYTFDAGHIDLPPMGDLVEMVVMLFNYPGDFDLVFTHEKGGDSYSISRLELSEAVGGLESVEGLTLAKEFLKSQEDALGGGGS